MLVYRPNGSYIHSSRPDRRDHVPSYREGKKRPKSPEQPVRASTSIQSYIDLRNALIAIVSGRMNPCQFTTNDGLDMERLLLVQSLRDRGVSVDVPYVARLGYIQLRSLNSHKSPKLI